MNVLERKELLASLPDGMYVLREDVTNPAADKRERHDWRKVPLWKAGMRFVLQTVDLGVSGASCVVRELMADRHMYDTISVPLSGAIMRSDRDLERLDALLPALTADRSADAELRWVFRRAGFNLDAGTMAAAVLRTLVLNRNVSIVDVAAALDIAGKDG